MPDLQGKIAFVTGVGAASSIGRTLVNDLAAHGAKVVINDLRPMDREGWRGAASIAKEIRAKGGEAVDVYGDVSDPEAVKRMYDEVFEAYGRLDIHVANAACPPVGDRVPVVDMPIEAFDMVTKVNLRGSFLTCQESARRLIAQGEGGRIILMSSSSGKRALPNTGAYAASKFAVNGLMQCLALELGSHGITVNSVCPGAIITDRVHALAEANRKPGQSSQEAYNTFMDAASARIPLGRFGTPQDVAATVSFLCSDRAAFITGVAMSVSGGAVMH